MKHSIGDGLVIVGILSLVVIAAIGCSVVAETERETQTLQLGENLFQLASLDGLGNIVVPNSRLEYPREQLGDPVVQAIAYGMVELRDSLPADLQPHTSTSQITEDVLANILSDMQRAPEAMTIVSVPVPSAALDLEVTESMEQVGLWQIMVFGLSRQPNSVADLQTEDIIWTGLDVGYIRDVYDNGERVIDASVWLEPLCAANSGIIDACSDSDGDSIPDVVDARLIAAPESRERTISTSILPSEPVIYDIQFVEGLDSQVIPLDEGQLPELFVAATNSLGENVPIGQANNPFSIEQADDETYRVVASAAEHLQPFYTYLIEISASLSGSSAVADRAVLEYNVYTRLVVLESSKGLTISVGEVGDRTVDLTEISFAFGRSPAAASPYQITAGNDDGVFSIDDQGKLTASNWDFIRSDFGYRSRQVVVQGTDSVGNVGNIVIEASPQVDGDGDGLIEISTLEQLNNIRYNIAGDSYKDSEFASGNAAGCPSSGCIGYELTESLDFDSIESYASGVVNNAWRPNNTDPDLADNPGWMPIGGQGPRVSTIFEGNGNTITGLYTRSSHADGSQAVGLFGSMGADSAIRNVGLIGVNIYGGPGYWDSVGSFAGRNNGTVIASYATGNVNGGDGPLGSVGGLIGANGGVIIASYSNVTVDGGKGNDDTVGGLVGQNAFGSIIASYAIGNAYGGDGRQDFVGAIAGTAHAGSIIASYATGTVDGGAGDQDFVGSLLSWIGISYATTTSSYGFGEVVGVEVPNRIGIPPAEAATAADLTATNAGAQWNDAENDTLNAWDFGSGSQAPALRFADYDGSGTDYSCDMFPDTLPDGTPIVCGTTLIPGQNR